MTVQKNKNKIIASAAILIAMAAEASASEGCATFSDKKLNYYADCQALLERAVPGDSDGEDIFDFTDYRMADWESGLNWATEIKCENPDGELDCEVPPEGERRVAFHSENYLFLWKILSTDGSVTHDFKVYTFAGGIWECSGQGGDYDPIEDRYVIGCYANGITVIENFSQYFDFGAYEDELVIGQQYTGPAVADFAPRMHNAYFFEFPDYGTDVVGAQIFAGWSNDEPGDSSGYGISVWQGGNDFVDTDGDALGAGITDLTQLEFKGARSLAQSKDRPNIIFAIGESTQPSGAGISYLKAFQRQGDGKYTQLNNENEGKGYALGAIGTAPHTADPECTDFVADKCVGGGADVFIYPSKEGRDEVICTSDRYTTTKQIRCFTFDAVTATFLPADGTNEVLTGQPLGRHTTAFAMGQDEYIVTSHQSGALTSCKNLLANGGVTCDPVIQDPAEQFLFFLPLIDNQDPGTVEPCDESALIV